MGLETEKNHWGYNPVAICYAPLGVGQEHTSLANNRVPCSSHQTSWYLWNLDVAPQKKWVLNGFDPRPCASVAII